VGPNDPEPLIDLAAEEAVLEMNAAVQLLGEAAGRERWDARPVRLEYPTPPCDPDVEVENSR